MSTTPAMNQDALPQAAKTAVSGAAHGSLPTVEITQRVASGVLGVGGASEFRAEGVTLILGNCLDYLPIIADAVVSDPPYGMNLDTDNSRFTAERHSTTNGKRNAGKHDGLKVLEDDQPFDPSPWLKYPAVVLFGSNHYAARLPVGTTLVWLKRNDAGFGTFLSDAEVAWMKGGHGVYAKRDLSMNGEALRRCHPCQKPVALMAWVMERAKVPVGATVLDPYMGSGSTGLAAIRTGRKFIGIERDPVHFASAVQRIRAELAQGVLSLGGGGGSSPKPSTAEKEENDKVSDASDAFAAPLGSAVRSTTYKESSEM